MYSLTRLWTFRIFLFLAECTQSIGAATDDALVPLYETIRGLPSVIMTLVTATLGSLKSVAGQDARLVPSQKEFQRASDLDARPHRAQVLLSVRQQVVGETVLVRAAELLPQGREIERSGSHLRVTPRRQAARFEVVLWCKG